ncbi:hypothetical protein D3C86_2033000 [compost metagenome]
MQRVQHVAEVLTEYDEFIRQLISFPFNRFGDGRLDPVLDALAFDLHLFIPRTVKGHDHRNAPLLRFHRRPNAVWGEMRV